jgi:hypothetical protein
MVQEAKSVELTEKEFETLSNILYFYKDFEMELYEYPDPKTLFTKTIFKLFDIFEVEV